MKKSFSSHSKTKVSYMKNWMTGKNKFILCDCLDEDPDDHTIQTSDNPRFKPLTMEKLRFYPCNLKAVCSKTGSFKWC